MQRNWVALILGAMLIPGARTAAQEALPQRPIVIELFTSEGCSSCPPADAFLTELAQSGRDLLPLAFHVTYWNGLGWRDPYALQTATDRQRGYARQRGNDTVFTPEMVVDGSQSLVGSDRGSAAAALQQAEAGRVTAAGMRIVRTGEALTVDVGGGAGAGTVFLVGFDPAHRTLVSRGENGGRTLTESNIVRSIQPIGQWTGAPLHLQQSLPPGQAYAAILQSSDGQIIGATRLPSAGS